MRDAFVARLYDEFGPTVGFERPTMNAAVIALVAFLCWPDDRFKRPS